MKNDTERINIDIGKLNNDPYFFEPLITTGINCFFFYKDGKQIGKLTIGDKIDFEGDFTESALLFFNEVNNQVKKNE